MPNNELEYLYNSYLKLYYVNILNVRSGDRLSYNIDINKISIIHLYSLCLSLSDSSDFDTKVKTKKEFEEEINKNI